MNANKNSWRQGANSPRGRSRDHLQARRLKDRPDLCRLLLHFVQMVESFESFVAQGIYGGGKLVKYLEFVGAGFGFNVIKAVASRPWSQ